MYTGCNALSSSRGPSRFALVPRNACGGAGFPLIEAIYKTLFEAYAIYVVRVLVKKNLICLKYSIEISGLHWSKPKSGG